MKIEVIGSGCKKCKELCQRTKDVVKELGINEDVKYSTDINKIVAMGLMSSPVLIIDNKPVLIGTLPTKEALKQVISEYIS